VQRAFRQSILWLLKPGVEDFHSAVGDTRCDYAKIHGIASINLLKKKIRDAMRGAKKTW
jgi:hypothetical protein